MRSAQGDHRLILDAAASWSGGGVRLLDDLLNLPGDLGMTGGTILPLVTSAGSG